MLDLLIQTVFIALFTFIGFCIAQVYLDNTWIVILGSIGTLIGCWAVTCRRPLRKKKRK